MMKKNDGFTLVELMIVVVIIGIIAAFAIPQLIGIRRAQRNMLQSPRLAQYLQAQEKYKSNLGNRRYGTLKQLCVEKLLSETVAKMSADCNTQTAVSGWIIVPGDESAAYLQNNFFAVLRFENRDAGETFPIFCGGSDGVIRRAASDNIDVCTNSSAPIEP